MSAMNVKREISSKIKNKIIADIESEKSLNIWVGG
jgi:hypothetical protein